MEHIFNEYFIQQGKLWPDFSGLRFVINAVSKDQTKIVLNHVYIKDGVAVATDGHRLHEYKLEADIPDGYYLPVGCTQSIVRLVRRKDVEMENLGGFPDYKRLIPDIVDDAVINAMIPQKKGDVVAWHAIYARLIRGLPEFTGVNFAYFKDMFGSDIMYADPADGIKAIRFRGEKCMALMMPTRIEPRYPDY